MNEVITNEESSIEDMIYEIRGKQVMLDSDLAKLYHVETKRINEAVRRNPEKFPERFCFKLTDYEYNSLKSQNATSNIKSIRGGRRYSAIAFTEQGVAMLATILKSDVAVKVSTRIMDAFVAMHKYISNNLIEQKLINNIVLDNKNDIKDIKNNIKLLQESFKKIDEKKKINEIYFNGQIYDAYSKILDILNEVKEEIIIIDGYADKTTLDTISQVKVNTILITKKASNIKSITIKKYNDQYDNLKIIYDESFHDRYIIIDRKTIYHLGTSINYAGSRTFSINILEDKIVKEALIDKIIMLVNKNNFNDIII